MSGPPWLHPTPVTPLREIQLTVLTLSPLVDLGKRITSTPGYHLQLLQPKCRPNRSYPHISQHSEEQICRSRDISFHLQLPPCLLDFLHSCGSYSTAVRDMANSSAYSRHVFFPAQVSSLTLTCTPRGGVQVFYSSLTSTPRPLDEPGQSTWTQ